MMMTEPELDFSSRGKLPSNVHYTGQAWEPPDTDWGSRRSQWRTAIRGYDHDRRELFLWRLLFVQW
jgi:hypothetical protein